MSESSTTMVFMRVDQFGRITSALAEYKDAQHAQVMAIANAAKASAAKAGTLPEMFSGKARSCRADAEKELAMARVFEAAAELVSALDDAGFAK